MDMPLTYLGLCYGEIKAAHPDHRLRTTDLNYLITSFDCLSPYSRHCRNKLVDTMIYEYVSNKQAVNIVDIQATASNCLI